jgi:hypothetical protein
MFPGATEATERMRTCVDLGRMELGKAEPGRDADRHRQEHCSADMPTAVTRSKALAGPSRATLIQRSRTMFRAEVECGQHGAEFPGV